jgi:hypothetical protein
LRFAARDRRIRVSSLLSGFENTLLANPDPTPLALRKFLAEHDPDWSPIVTR